MRHWTYPNAIVIFHFSGFGFHAFFLQDLINAKKEEKIAIRNVNISIKEKNNCIRAISRRSHLIWEIFILHFIAFLNEEKLLNKYNEMKDYQFCSIHWYFCAKSAYLF